MMYTKSSIQIYKIISLFLCTFFLFGCSSKEPVELDTEQLAKESKPIEEEIKASTSNKVTSLAIGVLKDTGTLHPLYANNEQTEDILSFVFEPAIKLDSTDTPQPSVIESWNVENDGTEYTFKIRKNVFFHGSDATVTADDLVFAIEQILSSDSQNCRYYTYSNCIKSYKKVDELSFTVSLKKATKDVFQLMSFPVFPKSVYANLSENTYKTPVGTGAYRVESYDTESGFKLVKNEKWWRVPGDIETVDIKFYNNANSILEAYRNNEINTIINTDFSSAVFSSNTKSASYYTTTQYYDAVIPNCKKYPTNSTSVRQGISYAISRSDIIKQCLQGEGVSVFTPLRTDKWYMEQIEHYTDNDEQKALSCFKDAGYTLSNDGKLGHNGVQMKLKLIYTDSSNTGYKANVAAALRTQLSEVGIELSIEKLSSDEFVSALQEGEYDLALCSFYTNMNDDISTFFGSNATLNYGKFETKDISSLIDKANSSVEDDEAKKAYAELYQYLVENSPHIGLYYRTHSLVLPSGVVNVGLLRCRSIFTDINIWKKE